MDQISGLNIRHMTNADMTAISTIDQKITGRERGWQQKASSHVGTYHSSFSFVAEVEGMLVGFIIGDLRGADYALPPGGYIDIMGVDPEYQGKGIGKKLLEYFIRECLDSGIKARGLLRGDQKRMHAFLTSAGFQRGDLVEFVKGFD